MPANDHQHGGDHYVQYGELQPWDVVHTFGLGYFDGNAIKYLLRWRCKNGLEDLRKARHYIDKLIELEEAREAENNVKAAIKKVVKQ